MQETKQRTYEKVRQKQNKKSFLNKSRIAAATIIGVCILITAAVLIFGGGDKDAGGVNREEPIPTHNAVVSPEATATPEALPTAEPTSVPEATPIANPTPSPIDISEIDAENPANLTYALIVNGAEAEQKTAYLTFDDGPSANTESILDTLKNYNAKATFFVTGVAVEKNPELVRRIYDEGHSIGNHSYSHDYDSVYASTEQFLEEIDKNERLIGSIIGAENVLRLFRFPGGSFGEKRKPFRETINNSQYKYVDWNALNSDADGQPFSAERCMEEIKKYCTDKGDVIILMHDTREKTITAETLPQVLDFLASQGYKFERIVP